MRVLCPSFPSSVRSRLGCESVMKTGFERAERTVSQCGRLLLAVLLLLPSALGQAQALAKPEPATIRPFKLHVPDRVLIDLRRRLAETKWPDQLPGTTWEYGADIKKVRELAEHWENGYDWRAQEAKINRFDQFTTEIDGQQIYFIHQRSPRPDAIPLLLIHLPPTPEPVSVAAANHEYRSVPITAVAESATNPGKRFDAKNLEDSPPALG